MHTSPLILCSSPLFALSGDQDLFWESCLDCGNYPISPQAVAPFQSILVDCVS